MSNRNPKRKKVGDWTIATTENSWHLEKPTKKKFYPLVGVELFDARRKQKAQPEYKIQAAFVREMAVRYPNVMVFSDTAAHIKKTLFQQVRANALSSPNEKWPDVFIAQPSGEYAGMYLEFKAETPYKVDGVTLKKNDHIEAQAATMQKLRDRGYFVPDFVWTVEMAMEQVKWYLSI